MPTTQATENPKLPADVTIYGVGALRSQFSTWLEELPSHAAALDNTPLSIDASGVSEVDAAGVQMLMALSKSLVAHKRPLELLNPSNSLVSALETLGASFP